MVGLLERKKWGRLLAIGYFSFLILDTLASAWIPGATSGFEGILFKATASLGLKNFSSIHSLAVDFFVAVVLFVVPLYILAGEKESFFEAGGMSTSQVPE